MNLLQQTIELLTRVAEGNEGTPFGDAAQKLIAKWEEMPVTAICIEGGVLQEVINPLGIKIHSFDWDTDTHSREELAEYESQGRLFRSPDKKDECAFFHDWSPKS